MDRIFFYGLFMDMSFLRAQGLHPRLVGAAELPMYQIHIGDRATLVPRPESSSYGMLIELPGEEAAALYSAPGVSDYRPEHVDAVLLSDRSVHPSLCYLLPKSQISSVSNVGYAEELSALVLELGLPSDYSSEIVKRGGV